MATTQPVLASNNLPHPHEYNESVGYRGAATEMADGSVVIDLVNTSVKRTFVLKWQNISNTDRNTVNTAYEAIKSSYTASNYTAPTGTTYTVTRDPGQTEIDWTSAVSAGALRWSGELRLREV